MDEGEVGVVKTDVESVIGVNVVWESTMGVATKGKGQGKDLGKEKDEVR